MEWHDSICSSTVFTTFATLWCICNIRDGCGWCFSCLRHGSPARRTVDSPSEQIDFASAFLHPPPLPILQKRRARTHVRFARVATSVACAVLDAAKNLLPLRLDPCLGNWQVGTSRWTCQARLVGHKEGREASSGGLQTKWTIHAHDVDVSTVGVAASHRPQVPPNKWETNELSLKSATKGTNIFIRCTYKGLSEREERSWRKLNVMCSSCRIQMKGKNRVRTSHECFCLLPWSIGE